MIYVAPDVPTDDTGKSSLDVLDGLLRFTLANTRPDAVIVVLSQVPPGYTRARQQAGRLLYYQVETLIFGRAVERATEPERYIVGCADPAEPLPAAMQAYLESFGCPILPMRYESAELCKIAINCCLVSSISVANTLAEVCEGIGADWSEIVPALKLDRRIGAYSYLAPGLGIAGGNLERDLATIVRLSAASAAMPAWSRPGSPTAGTARVGRADCRKPFSSAAGRHDRGLGARLQRKHPFHQEFAVARHHLGAAGRELVLHDPVVNAAAARTRRARPNRWTRSRAPMR